MPYPKLDRFAILKRLSRNAFYTLYEAVELNGDNRVHLKLLNKEVSSNPKRVLRLFVANAVLNLSDCPCVCKIHSCGRDRNYYYLATEHLDSKTWGSLRQENDSVSYVELLEIFTRIAMALRHAHLSGIIHGSLHPDCIYVASDLTVKIDAFGFHTLIPEIRREKIRLDASLKNYFAPEVLNLSMQVDGRADVYSLAMILFHILSGYLPFSGSGFLSDKDHRLLVSFAESLFSKALHKNPDARLSNLKDFVMELKKLNQELFGPAEVIEVVEEELKFKKFHSNATAFSQLDAPTSSLLHKMQRLLRTALF